MTASRRARLGAAALAVLAVLGATAYLSTPRDHGLTGDWATKAVDGPVVAGRALVSNNTAIDLRTGRTVRLGSVPRATPFVGDERLILQSAGRIDSARLDASARWTWRAPDGATATPVAAVGGSTMVRVCGKDRCELVGLNARGTRDWSLPSNVTDDAEGPSSRHAGLASVFAERLPGGGIQLTDPVTGRQSLQAGNAATTADGGPVLVADRQQGQCVVTAFTTPDPLWTRLLGPCPGAALPQLAKAGTTIQLSWPGSRTRLLDAATGRDVEPVKVAQLEGVVAQVGGVVATASRQTQHGNPLHWGQPVHVLRFHDAATGRVRAELVSPARLDLLALTPQAVVVREGDDVVRYTLDGTDS